MTAKDEVVAEIPRGGRGRGRLGPVLQDRSLSGILTSVFCVLTSDLAAGARSMVSAAVCVQAGRDGQHAAAGLVVPVINTVTHRGPTRRTPRTARCKREEGAYRQYSTDEERRGRDASAAECGRIYDRGPLDGGRRA